MAVPFDAEAVRTLAQILADTGLTEIEIESGDSRIRVARAHPPMVQAALAPVPVAAPPPAAAPQSAQQLADEDALHPGAVLSPMVGIAYLVPEPGATPFVVPGQEVIAGQTLLLIEAMKTFNQIKAPRSGIVTRILIGSGTPVEYGEPLLIVE